MDTVAFAKWLAGIGLLVSTQRGQAFRALALAEAIDPIEWSDPPIDDPAPHGAAEAGPSIVVAKTVGAAPDEGLLSKVGRGRIASFGCPHCGRDDIRPWGKPRYRCANYRKTFNPLTGTPLAGLHHQDRWHDQA